MPAARFPICLRTAYIVFCSVIISFAQDESYIISEEAEFIINSQTYSVYSVQRKIWINDEKDKYLGTVRLWENEFRRSRYIKGRVLDKNGKTLKKLRRGEIEEGEYSPGYELYSGSKIRAFSLSHSSLPYIVEYSYRLEIKSLFFWPDWIVQDDLPVARSKYTLTAPYNFPYQVYSIGPIPDPVSTYGGKSLVWELTNIPPFEDEYRMAPEDRIQYALYFAPERFNLSGTTGAFKSWESFAAWYHRIYQDQYQLEPASIRDMQLSESLSSHDKLQAIYSYLQERTRYVAIEAGIHGWKPYPAQSVCDNGYGDCKGLATFFISMLRLHGITAYPAILRTRNRGIVHQEFPAPQFNHVIAFVPLDPETLWVDCTDDYTIIDDLPYQNEGCHALVIRNGTGELIKTPASQANDNQVLFTAEAVLSWSGSMTMKGSIQGHGNSAQYLRQIFRPATSEKRREIILHWLSDYSPSVDLIDLAFRHLDDNTVSPLIEFECTVNSYAGISRNRIFLNPSFFRRLSFTAETPEERKTPVFYNYPYTYIDQIIYKCPDGLILEAIPESTSLEYPFGQYDYLISSHENQVSYRRSMRIKERLIPRDQYDDYYSFMESIEDKDNDQIVFLKRR